MQKLLDVTVTLTIRDSTGAIHNTVFELDPDCFEIHQRNDLMQVTDYDGTTRWVPGTGGSDLEIKGKLLPKQTTEAPHDGEIRNRANQV